MKSSILSPARLAANRLNGGKSQGPRTVAGKARSSRNALRTGRHATFTAGAEKLAGLSLAELHEDPKQLAQLRRGLEESFHPATPAEALMVEDLALLRWQRYRLERAQTARVAHRLENLELQCLRRSLYGNYRTHAHICGPEMSLGLIWGDDSPAKFQKLLEYLEEVLEAHRLGKLRADDATLGFVYGKVPSVRGTEICALLEQNEQDERLHAAAPPQEEVTLELQAEPDYTGTPEGRIEVRNAQIRRAILEEIANVVQDYQLFRRMHVEVTPAMRDECLAPTVAERWLISQLSQVDRQIERKTLLLLQMQRERQNAEGEEEEENSRVEESAAPPCEAAFSSTQNEPKAAANKGHGKKRTQKRTQSPARDMAEPADNKWDTVKEAPSSG